MPGQRASRKALTAKPAPPPEPPPIDPARVEQVIQWLIAGNRDLHIVEAIRETWPDQALDPLIATACAQLMDAGQVEPDAVKGWCLEASRELYRRMLEVGDLVGALRAVKQVFELSR